MTPTEVVAAMYEAAFKGDVEGALAFCADDAEYHAVTPLRDVHGTYTAREYFAELLPKAIQEMGEYRVEHTERHAFGRLVVSYVRSTHGEGTMTFRVVDGKIVEIWALNADGRDTTDYF